MINKGILGLKKKVGALRYVGVLYVGLVYLLGQSLTVQASAVSRWSPLLSRLTEHNAN